jgi:hypothetical protein
LRLRGRAVRIAPLLRGPRTQRRRHGRARTRLVRVRTPRATTQCFLNRATGSTIVFSYFRSCSGKRENEYLVERRFFARLRLHAAKSQTPC